MVAKGLLLKGGAGLATAAAGGTGIYYGVDHYLNQSTKFDQGLIDHLNADGKIKFAVLSGSDGTTALSSFPSLTSDQTVVAIVKVSTNGTTETTEGKIEDKDSATDGALGTKKHLKKLNGDGKGEGADWTWTCEIQFKKEAGASGANELKAKDEIFKNDGSGFLNKLKGDGEKDLKIKFIRDCAKARTKEKNRAINGLLSGLITGNDAITEANKIKSTKEFTLRAGNTQNNGEVTTNLYPVKKWEFNDWFSIKEQK